jgi:GlcNAc-P-P-Und epimerase
VNEAVLLTGASGFLGRHIVRAFVAAGVPVSCLCRRPVKGATWLCADLTQDTMALPEMQFGVVYHVAGLAHQAPGVPAREFDRVNREGTGRLIRALEQSGRLPEALVLISSVAVYGRRQGEGLDEDTPREAMDPYGRSKREAEDLVLAWGLRHGVRIGIVRLPLVASAAAPGNLGAMVDAIRTGRYLGIGCGDARRSMVQADDVARALPVVASTGGTYHLTDGHHPSFAELEAAIARCMNRQAPRRIPVQLARLAGVAGDLAQSCSGRRMPVNSQLVSKMTLTLTFSDQRARAELGWSPRPVVDDPSLLVDPTAPR